MPIRINELKENSLDEDEKAVYNFLKEKTENAYTESDIIMALNDYIFQKYNNLQSDFEKQKALENFKLLTKLNKLIRLKLVHKMEEKGKKYFYVED